MTIPETISKHRLESSRGIQAMRPSPAWNWRLACVALGTLAVAMSSDVARSHGMGVKSGYVCPYGQVYLCFNGACACYESEKQSKTGKRQKALKRVTNPCGVEPCSPGAAGKSRSSAIDRLGGGTAAAPSGGAGGGGGSAAKSSAGGGASSAPGGGSSAPNIGTNTFMKSGGTSPGQGQSPGLR